MLVSKTMVAAMAAVAVFVKTPQLSAVKTRLAATIGSRQAQRVYEESLHITRRRLQQVARGGIPIQWAVAEQQAAQSDYWSDFPARWTGEGTLGERLHQVYARLQQQYGRAILIGADCPQLSAQTIIDAAAAANTVIGPAQDGGFYLFASSRAISMQQWTTPAYSSANTLNMLTDALGHDDITRLPVLTDIDDTDSLAQCIREFSDKNDTLILQSLLTQ